VARGVIMQNQGNFFFFYCAEYLLILSYLHLVTSVCQDNFLITDIPLVVKY
jgi:hypothetical protein